MARVKIDLPEKFDFTTTIPVRIGDVNYGGHLGNDAVLSIMHEARIRMLAAHKLTELDIGGASIIMADTAIVYRSEGFYGDELAIDVAVTSFSSAGFDMVYRITKPPGGKEVAIGKTGIVCFDYDNRKVVPVPAGFKQLFVR